MTADRRFVLATKNYGEFIGTAEEVTTMLLEALGNKLEICDKGYVIVFPNGHDSGIYFTQSWGRPTMQVALRHHFNELIAADSEYYSVYFLDGNVRKRINGRHWEKQIVEAFTFQQSRGAIEATA